MPAAVDTSDPFRALSDPTRRQMVSLLAVGPLPVRMIAGHFPSISRPAVSKHLRVLREGNLVSEERSGRERFYRLELKTVQSTLAWMVEVSEGAGGSRAGRRAGARREKAASKPKPARAGASRTKRKTSRPPRRESKKSGATPAREADDWKSW